MESIYWVLSWACHRKCRHCYEDRFRPYVRDALEAVIAEAERHTPRVIGHLPDRLIYLDASGQERPGRVILSGGEALLDGVRTRVTYPTIERLVARYGRGGVRVIVQTTGDLLTPPIVAELLDRGVSMISIAGLDAFHVGLETEPKRDAFRAGLVDMLTASGLREAGLAATDRSWQATDPPTFSFFGATPDAWIGKLWPRGRAWQNGLSSATLADNFCNRWSGGLNFLNHHHAGSEVSIEPDGSVYPCCLKTRLPLGDLLEERLVDILDSLADDPVYQAINAGRPELMGQTLGWSEAEFRARSRTTDPAGRDYANLCIGCDRFHEEMLGPRVAAARARRLGLAAVA